MQVKRSLVDPTKCANCQPCPAQLECSRKAIVREEANDKPYVDLKCSGCAKCVTRCPYRAISMI